MKDVDDHPAAIFRVECNQDMVKLRGKVTWMVSQKHGSPFICQWNSNGHCREENE
jgi:hypothetical protein